MWKIWATLTLVFLLGATPRFWPALLEAPPPQVSQELEPSEYWPVILGHKIKITDSLLALFTLGLWWSTSRLWAAGERQAALNQRQVKVAENEFNYIHRPRLTVRRPRVKFNPKDNGINFVLVNMGHLTATEIFANFNIRVVLAQEAYKFREESLPPYDNLVCDVGKLIDRPPRNRPTLEGEESTYIYVISDQISDESFAAVKRGFSVLIFFGYLTFVGPDGITRNSAFYRTYEALTEEFIVDEDPDYEHF